MKVKIYAGISLLSVDVKKILPMAVVAPPCKRGDLLKDLKSGFHIVGIIDGVFFQTESLAPSEVIDAMRSGVKIFGSSSMGALRAAELENYGMIGVGKVYEHIRSNSVFEDDFLGQVFSPQLPIPSAPSMVEIELSLKELCQKKQISLKQMNLIQTFLSKLHFTERSLAFESNTFKKLCSSNGIAPLLVRKIVRRAVAKKTDGILMLKSIQSYIKDIQRFNKL